ncbi:hypothetical protein DICPUDRAFT_74560 [Dictyostelium purpureum]|uniref:Large ribosomal subunit protein uL23m n=1 Tax=Dictyostelium purpureum TaxID=5786 RepID=F0Z837_DICPU|nr:uncharacterized protein DICPUDRAFT_74560 [Dictyostelium purpureum]EGC39860.1 hypothetical protein DICPUDRAFT_74560 [Dictyostelium purpureum]|eukprot:XP_003283611.1 hypothetical protein DICPUDRAFT_74560 [Dictyostelium purpureum]
MINPLNKPALGTRLMNHVFFPNLKLQVIRNTQKSFPTDGKLMFKTNCDVGKVDIKTYVKALYGTPVDKVNTINVQGRIKQAIKGFGRKASRINYKYKTTDYKKAIITVDESLKSQLSRKKLNK